MLADAHYLQEKFSVLKNVGAPTGLLKNFVAEKALPRRSAFSSIRATASPNERIKGLLSRRDSGKSDKPLPAVSPSPAPSPPPPQETPTNDVTAEEDRSWSPNLDAVVVPPRGISRGVIGFKQIESPSLKIDVAEKEEALPPLPEDANHTPFLEVEQSNHVAATEAENEAASTPSHDVEEREAGDSRDEVPPAEAILPCNGDS
jgi:vacuolar protein sorting-associated protein 54